MISCMLLCKLEGLLASGTVQPEFSFSSQIVVASSGDKHILLWFCIVHGPRMDVGSVDL